MKKGKILCFFMMLLSALTCGAQATGGTAKAVPDFFVSPYYFGPNAFPIPDILFETSGELKATVAGDYFNGKKDDTWDILLKTTIPLWTHRANLTLWWPVMEWYNTDSGKGSMSGDVYVSIDLQLLEDSGKRPSWTLRAALKTASGGGYSIRRYYDSAGYFFDSYVGKTFKLGSVGLQVCAGGGFLCWQTDNGKQNDAVQYGVMVGVKAGKFNVKETFGGYSGWQSNSKEYGHLVHDRPMSLKTYLGYTFKTLEFYTMVQHGLVDYPYTQVQVGCTVNVDILRRR